MVQMTGRGEGRSGTGRGRGHFQGRDNSGVMSQPQVQPIGNTAASRETGESNNPSQEPLERGQISSNPWQRPSLETESSRNLDRSVLPSPEVENGADDIDRAVGPRARDIVNYCGLIMRSTISFHDENWQKIVSKHGEAMWLKVKDKFEVLGGVREHVFQAFVIDTMRRLFRSWKARLSIHYSRRVAKGNILSRRPEDVELEDWEYLVEYFGSPNFKGMERSLQKSDTRKRQIQEASVSSAIEIVRQEMQADMDRKLQEEREQMAAELKRNMEQELQRKLEEKLEHVNLEVDNRISLEVARKIQEQLGAFMTRMQQGQGS
ncbi:hypothetical protein A4A49_23778 [Nicotiana attenuata]|uniref:Uncharacterized protein n=1 Tax=Nicotiana attenuata TaxID=49451 RepID=A0A314LDW9_NICAT|nr:hypothetical protein A4A49_23778 [Nicotiana attenuata]